MDRKSLFAAWFQEFIQRFFVKSPAYFQVWQKIGIVCALLGFLPDALDALDVVVAGKWAIYLGIAMKAAGFVTWLQAKQPVQSFTQPTIKGKEVQTHEVMPYSVQKANETLND